MFRSPVLRTASLLTNRASARFCSDKNLFYQGLHDPNRHITMNHFHTHNYVDYWPTGQYPEVYIQGSVSPKTYQPQVQKILTDVLNSRYNSKLTYEDIKDEKIVDFFSDVLKTQDTFQQFQLYLNHKLSSNILVKESRWTWITQQQVRAQVGSNLYSKDLKTFSQFVQAYNDAIFQLVNMSHFGLSPKIEQQETAQQKYFYRQLDDEVVGIEDLKDKSRPQNSTFLNKIMNSIHSL